MIVKNPRYVGTLASWSLAPFNVLERIAASHSHRATNPMPPVLAMQVKDGPQLLSQCTSRILRSCRRGSPVLVFPAFRNRPILGAMTLVLSCQQPVSGRAGMIS